MNICALIVGVVFTVGNVQFEMAEIPGGAFLMGGTEEQRSEVGSTDLPVHRVVISPYLIGKTEVTRRLWKAVMGEDSGDWMADDLPIEWVSWEQCQVFIRKLDSITPNGNMQHVAETASNITMRGATIMTGSVGSISTVKTALILSGEKRRMASGCTI